MPISIACPGCAKRYDLNDAVAGKTARCRQCGQVFKVPVPRTAPTPPPAPRPVASPPSRPEPVLDEFTANELLDDPRRDEVLDDFEEADEDALAAPVSRRVRKPAHGSPLAGLSLPLGIFFGGSALLWGFLLLVVWPSIQGREGGAAKAAGAPAANAPPQVPAEALRHMPPEMRREIEQAQRFARQGAVLPAPGPELYPAGRQPAAGGGFNANVVAQHERAARDMLGMLDRMTNELKNVRDLASTRDVRPRLQALRQEAEPLDARRQGLPTVSAADARELARRVANDARACVARLRAQGERIQAIPGLGLDGMQLVQMTSLMSTGVELMANPPQGPGGGPQPYVEVSATGVADGEVLEVIQERLRRLSDSPNGSGFASTLDGNTGRAQLRIWPVSDAQAFARRIDFGRASVSDGYKVRIEGLRLDPAEVSAVKERKKREEAERQKVAQAQAAPEAAAPAPPEDPQPPADADNVTRSLFKLKSSNGFRQREGLGELASMIPAAERREEVVSAVVPLATSNDHFTAIEGIKALANWSNPEAIRALVHIVGRSDDTFVRNEAIKALGRLKAAEGAEAIAARIAEDWVEAPKALRAIGTPAEPAVIALLTDPEAGKRKAACEVLRDIGGPAAFAAMLKLPADPDTFVQGAARDAMQAISTRIGPDEVRKARAAAKQGGGR